MKMLLSLLVPVAVAMSSLISPTVLAQTCPTPPILPVACPASPGKSKTVDVHIRFGKIGPPTAGSVELSLNPPMRQMIRSLKQTRLTFTLQRIGGDATFDNKNVTIDGGPCHPWLSGSGSVNSTSTNPIEICLPSVVAAANETYYYTVTVEDIGILDPHVKVEP